MADIAIKEIYQRTNEEAKTILYHVIRYEEGKYRVCVYCTESEGRVIAYTQHTNRENYQKVIISLNNQEFLKTSYFLGAVRCL